MINVRIIVMVGGARRRKTLETHNQVGDVIDAAPLDDVVADSTWLSSPVAMHLAARKSVCATANRHGQPIP